MHTRRIALALYMGMAHALPMLAGKQLKMPDPVPLSGDSLGPRRGGRSIVGNRMNRKVNEHPHQGAHECQRRRLGGFHRLHHHNAREQVILKGRMVGWTSFLQSRIGVDLAREPDKTATMRFQCP